MKKFILFFFVSLSIQAAPIGNGSFVEYTLSGEEVGTMRETFISYDEATDTYTVTREVNSNLRQETTTDTEAPTMLTTFENVIEACETEADGVVETIQVAYGEMKVCHSQMPQADMYMANIPFGIVKMTMMGITMELSKMEIK